MLAPTLAKLSSNILASFVGRPIVGVGIRPGHLRRQDVRRHAFDGGRDAEAEALVLVQVVHRNAAAERRIEQRARDLDRHALADAIGAAGPSGVDQPAIRPVLADEVEQQVAVVDRPARHEGGAEAGGERRLRLGDALLGAGDPGGEAGQEIVDRLPGGQPGDRRQHAEGVGGQHDDVGRMARLSGRMGVGDMRQRIGGARVLRLADVVELRAARIGRQHDILQHGAVAIGRRIDLRLVHGRKADHLGVAAALEVEDPGRAPAMLVVADKRTVGGRRKRRLAGARQAEEDRGVAVLADIGRAVHRQHAALRQDVVQIGEDGLLDLAGIARPGDEDRAPGEIAGDDRRRAHAIALGLGLESGHGDDRQPVLAAAVCRLGRQTQQVADEKRVPGKLGEDLDVDLMLLVRARHQVLDEELLAAHMVEDVCAQALEGLSRDRRIGVPVHRRLGRRFANDELVLGRAAGVVTRVDHQGAVAGQFPFAAVESQTVKRVAVVVAFQGRSRCQRRIESALRTTSVRLHLVQHVHVAHPSSSRSHRRHATEEPAGPP